MKNNNTSRGVWAQFNTKNKFIKMNQPGNIEAIDDWEETGQAYTIHRTTIKTIVKQVERVRCRHELQYESLMQDVNMAALLLCPCVHSTGAIVRALILSRRSL